MDDTNVNQPNPSPLDIESFRHLVTVLEGIIRCQPEMLHIMKNIETMITKSNLVHSMNERD